MLEISLVHAEPDALLVRRLGDYLERNCRVRIDYSLVVTEELPLLEAAGRAIGSDAAIIFVSSASVPGPLDRNEWEPLLVNYVREQDAAVAYVSVGPAPFPKVLLRTRSFDPADLRGIKRWILEIRPPAGRPFFYPPGEGAATAAEIESLRIAVADQPGTSAVSPEMARAFIEQVHFEFQGLIWVDARGASVACAAGELGSQLGLRLPGELQTNLSSIGEILDQYRCLVILENPSPEVKKEWSSVGLSSVLIVHGPEPGEPTLESTKATLHAIAGWVNNPREVPPSGHVLHTVRWLLADSTRWPMACELARAMAGYLQFQDRLAEAFELLEVILSQAIRLKDARIATEFGRDRGWILESWGRRAKSIHPFTMVEEPAVQLALW